VLGGVVDLSHGVMVEDQVGREVLTIRLGYALNVMSPNESGAWRSQKRLERPLLLRSIDVARL